MDNERKAGAGRAVDEADRDIDRRGSDVDTVADRAQDASRAIAGTGPEIARHIAQETPRTGEDGKDMEDDDTSMEEDDEDLEEEDLEDDDLEEDDDDVGVGVEAEDDERGTPGYGDRGTTPV